MRLGSPEGRGAPYSARPGSCWLPFVPSGLNRRHRVLTIDYSGRRMSSEFCLPQKYKKPRAEERSRVGDRSRATRLAKEEQPCGRHDTSIAHVPMDRLWLSGRRLLSSPTMHEGKGKGRVFGHVAERKHVAICQVVRRRWPHP